MLMKKIMTRLINSVVQAKGKEKVDGSQLHIGSNDITPTTIHVVDRFI